MAKLTVYGRAAPKGDLKCIGAGGGKGQGRHVLVDSDSAGYLAPWMEAVTKAGQALHRRGGYPLLGAVTVDITVTIERPRSISVEQREWPHTRGTGDIDKLERAIFDALQRAQVIADDAQIVAGSRSKCYPDTPGAVDRLNRPGVVIRIERID